MDPVNALQVHLRQPFYRSFSLQGSTTTWDGIMGESHKNRFTGWMPSSFCVGASSSAVLKPLLPQFSGYVPAQGWKQQDLSLQLVETWKEQHFDAGNINRLRNLAVLDVAATGLCGEISDIQ